MPKYIANGKGYFLGPKLVSKTHSIYGTLDRLHEVLLFVLQLKPMPVEGAQALPYAILVWQNPSYIEQLVLHQVKVIKNMTLYF